MDGLGPHIIKFPPRPDEDPIVITGVGIACSLGDRRETVWQEIQRGTSGIRLTEAGDNVGPLRMPCGMVDWLDPDADDADSIKSIRLASVVAADALGDANIPWNTVDRTRIACSISAQFGNIGYTYMDREQRDNPPADHPRRDWYKEFLPCSPVSIVANKFGLYGPRLCHTTACASGLISMITGARMLQSDQADYALCGATDAVTELVFSAFNRMGVLATADDPARACRPFDANRSGFVIGEGGAMLVLERRSHALARGAQIYAEFAASQTFCQAHHVTGLDEEAETLTALIHSVNRKAGWQNTPPDYISAHGTGTEQNDRSELMAIRRSFGPAADHIKISSNKAVIGHMVNAAGSIELALTALAIRDGYAPATMNLDSPEPIGNIDCLPYAGVQQPIDRALKLSLAFGGHLVGIGLASCRDLEYRRAAQPLAADALIRPQRSLQRAA